MPKREHTIIFLPHARARFRQFRVSSRALWSLAISFGLSVLLGVTFSLLWVRSIQKKSEVTAILAENSDLRSRAALTNTRLETIEKMLAEFEDRTRRLSIVAGLSAVRDPGMGGVGGLTALPVNPADSVDSGLSEAGRRGALLSSRLVLVEKRLLLQADQLALTPTIVPAAGVLTAGFGTRPDPFTSRPEFHSGIDISTPAGNRVVAPASGTIVRVGLDKGYGRFVEIAHGYGVTTLYGHLQAARVAEGQRVRRGDVVALVGSTGRSTGPHLHYEVRAEGKAVNPLNYVLNAF
jgi:murein DD-endopeptidase MepM/ murein hydrolase activator NlpD